MSLVAQTYLSNPKSEPALFLNLRPSWIGFEWRAGPPSRDGEPSYHLQGPPGFLMSVWGGAQGQILVQRRVLPSTHLEVIKSEKVDSHKACQS